MIQAGHDVIMTSWPSGLRRDVKAVVFIGVGSNPTDVTFAVPGTPTTCAVYSIISKSVFSSTDVS